MIIFVTTTVNINIIVILSNLMRIVTKLYFRGKRRLPVSSLFIMTKDIDLFADTKSQNFLGLDLYPRTSSKVDFPTVNAALL